MLDNDPYFTDEFDSMAPEAIWLMHDFSQLEAQLWVNHGFHDPGEARRWRDAVGLPDTAVLLIECGVPISGAAGWAALIEHHDDSFPLEDAYAITGGSPTLASAYTRHFPVDEWAALGAAKVPARATAHIARLSAMIDARDYDRGLENDRNRSIYEAALWLGDYTDLTTQRVSLLSNLVSLHKTPNDVPFALMDTGTEKVADVSARQAVLIDGWLQEAGYEADSRGLAAYRLIARLDAHPMHFGQLIRRFGLQRVVAALETGLDTFPQLQHHLTTGGVAEIARGAL